MAAAATVPNPARAQAQDSPPACPAKLLDPVDCSSGNSLLTQPLCEARGCCWHPAPPDSLHLFSAQLPAACLNGETKTPQTGVIGTWVWREHVAFGPGKTIDGDPVDAEIIGYNHDGKYGGPGPCCGNKFKLTVSKITSTGFDLEVERTDKAGKPGWHQTLIVGWKAGASSCKFPVGPGPAPAPAPGPPVPTSQCFYPEDGSPIEMVHMINSNHFDAGYADWTSKVLNEYFHTYFPRAAFVGAELLATTGQPLRWMTFSYIVSLFLDCPANYGVLQCPTAAEQANFTAAVKAGHIMFPVNRVCLLTACCPCSESEVSRTTQAFPTNAELALADPAILTFGVQMCKDLAKQLGLPPPGVVSTRDVPGMPRSAIPILKKAGVNAMSEGMNGRMVAVNAPPVFAWHDPPSGELMLTLWHFQPGAGLSLSANSHLNVLNNSYDRMCL
jgi:hypothetical protein